MCLARTPFGCRVMGQPLPARSRRVGLGRWVSRCTLADTRSSVLQAKADATAEPDPKSLVAGWLGMRRR